MSGETFSPPPHPTLSPRGEGGFALAASQFPQPLQSEVPPLPSGRGQGEGAASRLISASSHQPGKALGDITKRLTGKTAFARSLRSNETEEEYFLWSDLRNRRLNGFKFARQIPIGPYVADFICRERHLIVELDGGQHSEKDQDRKRTEWLNANGYSVIRFWNNEVRFERTAVLETILAALEGLIFGKDEAIRFSPAIDCSERRPIASGVLKTLGEGAAPATDHRHGGASSCPKP